MRQSRATFEICALPLLVSLVACERATEPSAEQAAVSGATTAPSLEQLSNATYQGVYDRPVRLSAGRFEGEPFEPGAASRPTLALMPDPIAYADLDGDDAQEAVVLLVESSGGSGSFVYLAVVALVQGEPKNLATELIGDRVSVVSLKADRGRIQARLMAGRPAAASGPLTRLIPREWDFRSGALFEQAVYE